MTRPWSALDWIIRGKSRRSGQNKTTAKSGGRSPAAPDWIISGGTSSRSHRRPDGIIRGQVEARSPGLDHPGRNKQQKPSRPGLEHPGTSSGLTPRTGSSWADQAAGAAAPRTGSSREKWPADAPDWVIRGRARRSGHNPQGQINRGKVASRPGQDCPGRIKQKESTPPRLERPGERGGQRRGKQRAEATVVQRWNQDRKQRKGQGHGDAQI